MKMRTDYVSNNSRKTAFLGFQRLPAIESK
jgi:hypothetical protein